MQDKTDLTELLRAWQSGDMQAREELFNAVYPNMQAIARNLLMRDRQRFAVQATELVNECTIRMLGLNALEWRDRAHFVAVVSVNMRRILVDEARRKRAGKRDGVEITLVTEAQDAPEQALDLVRLEDALERLSQVDGGLARIVELKFFGGMTNEEVAEVEKISASTVKRNWRSARAWLYDELQQR